MKINPIAPQTLIKRYEVNKTQSVQSAVPPKADKVEFSTGGQSFADAVRAVKESMQAQESADSSRINDVAKQIENGTYNVSGRDVAEKMLQDLF